MKIKLVIPIISLIVLFTACAKDEEKPVNKNLRDDTERSDIMKSISADHDMMIEMVDHMSKSENAMQVIVDDHNMRNQIMGDKDLMMGVMEEDTAMLRMMMGNMMTIMENDSVVCKMMSGMMWKDKHMKGIMRHMGKKMEMKDMEMMEENGGSMHHHDK